MEYTIYKICCNDDSITDFYIGSTKNFIRRKSEHKCSYNNKNNKLYQFIREHNNWENFTMSIIETFICETKDEALKKEQYYIELLKPTLNKKNAFGFDNKKYYQDNKEQKREYQKQYHIAHKEERKEYNKQYRKELKDISL
jgi:predicted GIY-YIG superfamily endonuclease